MLHLTQGFEVCFQLSCTYVLAGIPSKGKCEDEQQWEMNTMLHIKAVMFWARREAPVLIRTKVPS